MGQRVRSAQLKQSTCEITNNLGVQEAGGGKGFGQSPRKRYMKNTSLIIKPEKKKESQYQYRALASLAISPWPVGCLIVWTKGNWKVESGNWKHEKEKAKSCIAVRCIAGSRLCCSLLISHGYP
jgi:hypothetical protein